jgi:hypothetical protein
MLTGRESQAKIACEHHSKDIAPWHSASES